MHEARVEEEADREQDHEEVGGLDRVGRGALAQGGPALHHLDQRRRRDVLAGVNGAADVTAVGRRRRGKLRLESRGGGRRRGGDVLLELEVLGGEGLDLELETRVLGLYLVQLRLDDLDVLAPPHARELGRLAVLDQPTLAPQILLLLGR